jgi:hypothetical protein
MENFIKKIFTRVKGAVNIKTPASPDMNEKTRQLLLLITFVWSAFWTSGFFASVWGEAFIRAPRRINIPLLGSMPSFHSIFLGEYFIGAILTIISTNVIKKKQIPIPAFLCSRKAFYITFFMAFTIFSFLHLGLFLAIFK